MDHINRMTQGMTLRTTLRIGNRSPYPISAIRFAKELLAQDSLLDVMDGLGELESPSVFAYTGHHDSIVIIDRLRATRYHPFRLTP